MNEMTSVATNGSCVTTMRKISAGSNGARVAHFRYFWRGTGGGRSTTDRSSLFEVAPRTAISLPLVLGGDLLSEPLTGVQRVVHRDRARDRRADLLRHLGAEVGELGDADELDARRRPRLHPGVERLSALDRGLRL